MQNVSLVTDLLVGFVIGKYKFLHEFIELCSFPIILSIILNKRLNQIVTSTAFVDARGNQNQATVVIY